jgi:hypothetical protein
VKGFSEKTKPSPVQWVVQTVIEHRPSKRTVKSPRAEPPRRIIQVRATQAIAVAAITIAIAAIAVETIIVEGTSKHRTAEWVVQSRTPVQRIVKV